MFCHDESLLCEVSNTVLSFIYCLRGVRRVKTRQKRIPLLGGLNTAIAFPFQFHTGDRGTGVMEMGLPCWDFSYLKLLSCTFSKGFVFSKDSKLLFKPEVYILRAIKFPGLHVLTPFFGRGYSLVIYFQVEN